MIQVCLCLSFPASFKNELFAFTDPPDRIIPLHLTDRPGKFQPDLLIRNMRLLRFLIIGKISQMDQSSFIYIDIIPDTAKAMITGIQIGSHGCAPPADIIIFPRGFCNMKNESPNPSEVC